MPSTAPPAAIYSPEEVTGVLHTLVTAVQEIRLYLASPYGPPPPSLLAAATGPPALPWYSPHSAASVAFARPLQPPPATTPQWPLPVLMTPPAPIAPMQQPPPASTPIWPQWPSTALAASTTPVAHMQQLLQLHPAAPVAPMQQLLLPQAPPPLSTGPTTTAPTGVPIQQVRFPTSPSPLPAWLAGSTPQSVYTMAGEQPAPTLQYGGPSGSAGACAGPAGPPFRGGPPVPTDPASSSSLARTAEPYAHGVRL
nr:proline-rich protein 36-like [Aegilops tauschii subsp. strangulata]